MFTKTIYPFVTSHIVYIERVHILSFLDEYPHEVKLSNKGDVAGIMLDFCGAFLLELEIEI